jgi:hypothetical protein
VLARCAQIQSDIQMSRCSLLPRAPHPSLPLSTSLSMTSPRVLLYNPGCPSMRMETSGYCSECICTIASIRSSCMVLAEIGLVLNAVWDAGPVWELEQISTSLSTEGRRVNILHIRSAKFCQGAIHPCGSNCHYDHIGSLKHLFSKGLELHVLPHSKQQGRTRLNGPDIFDPNRVPINIHQ